MVVLNRSKTYSPPPRVGLINVRDAALIQHQRGAYGTSRICSLLLGEPSLLFRTPGKWISNRRENVTRERSRRPTYKEQCTRDIWPILPGDSHRWQAVFVRRSEGTRTDHKAHSILVVFRSRRTAEQSSDRQTTVTPTGVLLTTASRIVAVVKVQPGLSLYTSNDVLTRLESTRTTSNFYKHWVRYLRSRGQFRRKIDSHFDSRLR